MSSKIYGDCELESSLYCSLDVLGNAFEIHLGKINGEIIFPKPSEKFFEIKNAEEFFYSKEDGLYCPIDSLGWHNKYSGLGTAWGQVNTDVAFVNRILLSFNTGDTSYYQNIYQQIHKWFTKFYIIKEILTKKVNRKLFVSDNDHLTYSGVNSFTLYTDKSEYIENKDPISINISFPKAELTKDNCNEIFNLTNSPKDVCFEYRLYVEGLRAFILGDYAKAVSISAPALEKALLKRMKEFADEKGLYCYEKIKEKYKMLGGYFRLAIDISLPLPTYTYDENIIKVRNKVIHEGKIPSMQETESFLNELRQYLDAFLPSILEK